MTLYAYEIDRFCSKWSPMCPIVDRSTFTQRIRDSLSEVDSSEMVSRKTLILIFQLFAAMAINALADFARQNILDNYDALLASLFPMVSEAGNIESLRGLLLYATVLQMEGRYRLATQVNGIIVRLAQSLGLHRHSRRFSHTPSEVEQRKRLWWSVFICDT